MTPDALEKRLLAGSCLALDTNVLWGFRPLGQLNALVREFNRRHIDGPQVQLIVPALVHAEMLHDLRCAVAARGEAYRAEEVARDLESKGVTLFAFEAMDGEGTSAQIFQQYSTDPEWQKAKLRNALRRLGLKEDAVPVGAKKFPATVDWFIAGQARQRGWLLVVHDGGPEFDGLERVKLAPLKEALRRLSTE